MAIVTVITGGEEAIGPTPKEFTATKFKEKNTLDCADNLVREPGTAENPLAKEGTSVLVAN